jgi:predicted AlkP superfamily pyrophosphatase or phosphodiesterase
MIWKKQFSIRFLLLLASISLFLTACPPKEAAQSKTLKSQQPKLVVGIVVDQMRFDYLQRFWPNFGEGGFKRLVGEGTSFLNCNYNYVPTETAPGHASIFTGTTPSGHGIVMNTWMDRATLDQGRIFPHSSVFDSLYPYVGIHPLRSKSRGISPRLLEASTIADQLKEATGGKAITVGVSLKDRSAVLPVGKSADAAYFFDGVTGAMISSSFYPGTKTTLPFWVDSLNALRLPLKYMLDPIGWVPLLAPERYTASDGPQDTQYEGTYGPGGRANFPHHIVPDSIICCGEFMSTAWGNEFLNIFAKEAVKHHGLGNDAVTDFLSLSFSSTDMVAHQFGPQSREVEDTYLRLDRDLADFLSFLDARIGKENVLVFLTADHGGAANPDYAVAHGERGGWLDDKDLHKQIRALVGDVAGKDSLMTRVQGHHIYLNHLLADRRNVNMDSLTKVVAAFVKGFKGIEGVFTAAEIVSLQPTNAGEQFLKNGFFPGRSGDVLYLESYGYMHAPYDPNETWRHKKGTSHGTHYEYDTHVPLIFWGNAIVAGSSDAAVVIPDIAATVCQRLGIAQTSKCSGKPIVFPK